MDNILGIIGGMGPLASNLFYRMVIEHTQASCDQDHINMIILNDAGMPDRTGAILSGNTAEPMARLKTDALLLQQLGCKAICVTCNTAHWFVHRFENELTVPVISLVRETAKEMSALHPGGKIAVLATDGTVQTGLYQEELLSRGLTPYVPSPENQKNVMHLIYDCVKAGKPADLDALRSVCAEVESAGCDAALLACTELPIIKEEAGLSDFYTDPMQIMARKAIEFMGKQYV